MFLALKKENSYLGGGDENSLVVLLFKTPLSPLLLFCLSIFCNLLIFYKLHVIKTQTGAADASLVADVTLKQAQRAMGFLLPEDL